MHVPVWSLVDQSLRSGFYRNCRVALLSLLEKACRGAFRCDVEHLL